MTSAPTSAARLPATDARPAVDGTREMPAGLDAHQVRGRLAQVAALVVFVGLVVALIPGLGDVRSGLARASGGWLVLAAGVEVLSCLAYVVSFRAAFCARMSWWMGYRLGMSSLGAASLLPVGGVGGLAFGAWALHRDGLSVQRVARRSVAFFLLTSATNVAAVVIVALALAGGVLPGTSRPLLIAGPLVLALAGCAAIIGGARLAERLVPRWSAEHHARPLRAIARMLDASSDGVREAIGLLRHGDARLLLGAVGYLVFDLAVFWVCFRAFGTAPALGGLLLAYLFGQLGAIVPVPGGIGGVELGLVGALVLYGTPVATATVGVLAYRAVLLGVPAALGATAFVALQRSQRDGADSRIPCADDPPPRSAATP